MEYWLKVLKCQIWLTNTKPFFWESQANLESLQKVSLYIWVSYKFALKSGKSLYRKFWAREYWFNALKCQTWLMNTKSFFCESKANIETLQNFSPYISVSYKCVLKSAKSLNRMFWAIEYWFKTLKSQIWFKNTKSIFCKNEANIETLRNFSPYISFSSKFVLKSVKSLNRILSSTEY